MEDRKNWNEETATRRFFINFSLLTAATVAVAGGLFPLIKYLFPRAGGAGKGLEVKIPLDEVGIGDARFFKFKGKPAVLVRKSDREVVALSAACTHLGCIIKYSAAESVFKCPCHGAKFDENGKVIGGPAPKPLEMYAAEIEGGNVVVKEA